MSHSPFWDSREFDVNEGAFLTAAATARSVVQAADPTAIVVIGPDHFRDFFYDVMTAFCIGTDRITSFGDYRPPRDDLPAATNLARSLHASVPTEGSDPDHHEINSDLRAFVIDGRASAREVQASREKQILASAATNNGRVNSEWDAWFLDQIAAGNLESVLEMTDDEIERDAGNGGHE